MTTITSDRSTQRQGRRKIAAVLAGGLVLGVGTMATLASWNDSEFAKATFTAGKFVFQGSTNGADYIDHETDAKAVTLPFTAPVTNMTPGDVVGAPLALRLGAGTTDHAKVTVTAPNAAVAGDNTANLSYTLVETATLGCTKDTVGTKTLITDAQVGAGTASFTLTKPGTTGEGTPIFLCFKVKASANLAQEKATVAKWLFAAESITTIP